MAKASLKKSERIKQRKLISQLFEEGKSIKKYPLKLVYIKRERPTGDPLMLFSASVPKRLFRKAVKRNLLKRRIKEAYRVEKSNLTTQNPDSKDQFALMFIYIGREIEPYTRIQKSVFKLLNALLEFN